MVNSEKRKVKSEMTKKFIRRFNSLMAAFLPVLLLRLSLACITWLGDTALDAGLWIEDMDYKHGVIISIFIWVILGIILFTFYYSPFTRFQLG
jgi:hypothetical protein